MKVLVIGTHGQLARSLAERALQRPKVELIALGRPDVDLEIGGSAKAAIIAAGPDVVINAAAYTAVDQAEDEPERAFRINANAAGEIADAAARIGAPIIQISTDYVFDGTGPSAYDEQTQVGPVSTYGRSKLAGEEQVRAANAHHTIVRTAWVYSPFGRNFVKSIMSAAETRDVLTVVDDQRGCPSNALDLADGLLMMIEKGSPSGEIYHLGGGETTWFEFARTIMENCSRLGLPSAEVQPIPTEQWPTKAERPRNSVLDSRKFRRDFGYSMPDWRVSVRAVIERLANSPTT
jgi:dTDP-4-dehydrorhamnose reductase